MTTIKKTISLRMGCLVNSILTSYSSGGVFLMSGLEFSVLVKRGEKRFVKGFPLVNLSAAGCGRRRIMNVDKL